MGYNTIKNKKFHHKIDFRETLVQYGPTSRLSCFSTVRSLALNFFLLQNFSKVSQTEMNLKSFPELKIFAFFNTISRKNDESLKVFKNLSITHGKTS